MEMIIMMINLFFFFSKKRMAFWNKPSSHFTNNWAAKQLEIFQKNKWSKGDHRKQEIYGCNFEPKWTCRAIYKIVSEMWKLMWVPLIWISRVWRTLIITEKPPCQFALARIQASTVQALETQGPRVHPVRRLVSKFRGQDSHRSCLGSLPPALFLLEIPLEVWKLSYNVGILLGEKKWIIFSHEIQWNRYVITHGIVLHPYFQITKGKKESSIPPSSKKEPKAVSNPPPPRV